MSAPWLMISATLLFAVMGVCSKLASAQYGAGEVVFYRGLVGALMMWALVRTRGGSLKTRLPAMHFWRGLCGVCALVLWFHSIFKLPLVTAMTLNYMSSVWMALFLVGGAVVQNPQRAQSPSKEAAVDGRLVASVLVGFAGVALILQPTIARDQLWHGLAGLASGLLAAVAYLQVITLGRAGEPEIRIVFYFSVAGVVAGGALMAFSEVHRHDLRGAGLLLAIGVLATTAQMMMTRAYKIGRTLTNACLQYLGIVFAVGFGALLFDDPVTGLALAGMLLIVLAGLAATLLRARQAPVATFSSGDS